MPRGGYRPGSGRKSLAEEVRTSDLAKAAIIQKWGSLEAGFKALLDMDEQALTKWVFEHAAGKPQDKVDVTTNGKDITKKEIVFRRYSDKS